MCVFALSLDSSSFSVVFFDDSMMIFVFSFSLCVFVYVYVVCVRAPLVVSRLVVFADLESSSGLLVLVVVQKVNVVFLRCFLVGLFHGTKENQPLEELKGRGSSISAKKENEGDR